LSIQAFTLAGTQRWEVHCFAAKNANGPDKPMRHADSILSQVLAHLRNGMGWEVEKTQTKL
jgi:hypothetical protein